jgi:hypothetical protein
MVQAIDFLMEYRKEIPTDVLRNYLFMAVKIFDVKGRMVEDEPVKVIPRRALKDLKVAFPTRRNLI